MSDDPTTTAPLLGLLEELSRDAGDGDEWYPFDPADTTFARLSEVAWRRVVYVTKWGVTSHWIFQSACHDGVSVLGGGFLPSTARARLVRREAEGHDAPIRFLGDLDPLDLTHYLALRAGGIGPAPTELDVTYVGVGDALIALCEAHVRSRERPLFERVTITMTDFERRHLAALEAVWPSMASVVGPRSVALLRAGRKLELEGAINPAFYDDAFPDALLAFVCGGAPTG